MANFPWKIFLDKYLARKMKNDINNPYGVQLDSIVY